MKLNFRLHGRLKMNDTPNSRALCMNISDQICKLHAVQKVFHADSIQNAIEVFFHIEMDTIEDDLLTRLINSVEYFNTWISTSEKIQMDFDGLSQDFYLGPSDDCRVAARSADYLQMVEEYLVYLTTEDREHLLEQINSLPGTGAAEGEIAYYGVVNGTFCTTVRTTAVSESAAQKKLLRGEYTVLSRNSQYQDCTLLSGNEIDAILLRSVVSDALPTDSILPNIETDFTLSKLKGMLGESDP